MLRWMGTLFIQIQFFVNPSLGPPLIINTNLCIKHSVSKDVIDCK